MRKLIVIVFVLALSMVSGVFAYNNTKIDNSAKLKIVPSNKALIAVNAVKPIAPHTQNATTDTSGVSPCRSVGMVEITNHSPNTLAIKQIKCNTAGFARLVTVAYKQSLPARRTVTAEITVSDGSSLGSIESLSFELEAEWRSGKAVIQFTVPVSMPVNEPDCEDRLDVAPDTTLEPVSKPDSAQE